MAQALKWLMLAVHILARIVRIAAQSPIGRPSDIPLLESRTRESVSIIIELQPEKFPYMLCRYPISGNYCTLPRVLFYLTIIAALVLRHYPWLRVGALATSLTYSAAAAIHACLIVWSGKAFGELDVIPLAAILSASCFVMVPLLTWSSTIRHAGKPREEKRHQEEKLERLLERLNRQEQEAKKVLRTDAEISATTSTFCRRRRHLERRNKRRENGSDSIAVASRTILLMWACLVSVGFLCTFVAIIGPAPRYGHFGLFDFSQATEILCTPQNGTLDLRPSHSSYPWGQFFITSDFLNVNNCIDPCPISPTKAGSLWFRDHSDLQSFSEMELLNLNPVLGGGNQSQKLSVILNYAYRWSFLCVYVLLQGICAVLLGRSQPSEVQLRIYDYITRLLTKGNRRPGTRIGILAKVVAFSTYLGALGIAVISFPLLVVNITLIELYIQGVPQSETPKHVGAWSPYAVIGLGLLCFFIANVQITHHMKGFWTGAMNALRCIARFLKSPKLLSKNGTLEVFKRILGKGWVLVHQNLMDNLMEQRNDILEALQHEWMCTKNFWKNADGELGRYQKRKEETREETALVI